MTIWRPVTSGAACGEVKPSAPTQLTIERELLTALQSPASRQTAPATWILLTGFAAIVACVIGAFGLPVSRAV